MYRVLQDDAVSLCRIVEISAARMELLVSRFDTTLVNVGVDLGCGNVCMAQHHLEGTKVCPSR
jgi:hypothetical protein